MCPHDLHCTPQSCLVLAYVGLCERVDPKNAIRFRQKTPPTRQRGSKIADCELTLHDEMRSVEDDDW